MPIGFRGAAHARLDLAGVSLAVARPTGTADGDLLVALISLGIDAAVVAPAGWTEVSTLIGGGGRRTAVYYRAAAGEPASYTWQFGAAVKAIVAHLTYHGVNTTAPIDALATTADATTRAAHPTPAATTVTGHCWLVSWASDAVTAGASSWSTSDASDAERVDTATPAPSVSLAAYDSARDLLLGSHSRTLTASQATSGAHLWSIALRPAAIAAGGCLAVAAAAAAATIKTARPAGVAAVASTAAAATAKVAVPAGTAAVAVAPRGLAGRLPRLRSGRTATAVGTAATTSRPAAADSTAGPANADTTIHPAQAETSVREAST